jgi:hypothetical protein
MKNDNCEGYLGLIKDGWPPPKEKRRYIKTVPEGMLMEFADTIQAGQYMDDPSAGSAGKFSDRVKARQGLEARSRRGQGESRGRVYVVTTEWLAANPNV